MTRVTIIRLGFVLVLAAAAAWVLTHRERFDVGAIEPAVRNLGVWAPAGFVLVYAVGTVLFFSGAILSLAGGALFGPVWGTLWNLLGATVAFLLAHGIAAEWVTRLGERMSNQAQGRCFLANAT